jgi:hypothetical protein
MRNNIHRTLLICVPLLVTACSDVNEPQIPDPKIATTAITSTTTLTSVSISWNKATDSRSPSTALVYKVYLSGANPAYQSFDTIAEVEAGTLVGTLTDASSFTISSDNSDIPAGNVAGNAYYINIVVLDEKGNKALYDPLGEYFHDNQISYYPFNGNGSDVTTTANHLVVAVDPTLPNLALPAVTSDRFGHTGSAYSFNPTVPQCLQSTNMVGIDTNHSRTVSLWVQSSNTTTGTDRAAFAWGNSSSDGSNFGFSEADVGKTWTVWLWGGADVPTGEAVTTDWEHWVVGYDSVTDRVYAYKNGVSMNTEDLPTPVANTVDSLLYVGCGVDPVDPVVPTGTLAHPYMGNIDDIRVFNQLLNSTNSTDVARLYAVTRP